MSSISNFSIMTNTISEPGIDRETHLKLFFAGNSKEENYRVLSNLVKNNDTQLVKEALKHMPPIKITNLDKLFITSARHKLYEIMNIFFKHKYYPSKNARYSMARDIKIEVKVFRILNKKKGICLNYFNLAQETVYVRCKNEQVQLRKLIFFQKQGVFTHENYNSLLHSSIINKHTSDYKIINYLLDSNANPNVITKYGTPLFFSSFNNPRALNLLLNAGADPNMLDNKHRPPLHYIVSNPWCGKKTTVQMLIDHGAIVNAKRKGFTALEKTLIEDGRYMKILRKNGGEARLIIVLATIPNVFLNRYL